MVITRLPMEGGTMDTELVTFECLSKIFQLLTTFFIPWHCPYRELIVLRIV